MLEQKGKGNMRKNNSVIWGNKPESTGERRKIKEISTKGWNNTDKTEHSKTTKSLFANNWEEMTRKYTNNRMKEKLNNFGLKYMATKTKNNGKAECIKNMTK